MGSGLFIARIFGPCYFIIALGMIFNRKFYQRLMEEYSGSAVSVFYGGLLALVVGLAIVLKHNVWTSHWTVVITLIGWAGLLKGIWLVVFPQTVNTFMRSYTRNPTLLRLHALVALILGAFLTIKAYQP